MKLGQFARRCVGALRLDAATHREIGTDPTSLRQAAVAVLIVAGANLVAAALSGRSYVGSILLGSGLIKSEDLSGIRLAAAVVSTGLWVLVAWAFETLVLRFLGTRLSQLDAQPSLSAVASPLGFTQIVGLISLVEFIPRVPSIAGFFFLIWDLAAFVVVTKVLFSVKTERAILIYI